MLTMMENQRETVHAGEEDTAGKVRDCEGLNIKVDNCVILAENQYPLAVFLCQG